MQVGGRLARCEGGDDRFEPRPFFVGPGRVPAARFGAQDTDLLGILNPFAQALAREADAIRRKIPKGSWVCAFAIEGKPLSSEALAGTLARVKESGKGSACFVIGSSFGLDEGFKKQADLRLSMSPMTFPHHLARVMALEQLYRAEAIQAGSKYHK